MAFSDFMNRPQNISGVVHWDLMRWLTLDAEIRTKLMRDTEVAW
jgi:hypothetical protein